MLSKLDSNKTPTKAFSNAEKANSTTPATATSFIMPR